MMIARLASSYILLPIHAQYPIFKDVNPFLVRLYSMRSFRCYSAPLPSAGSEKQKRIPKKFNPFPFEYHEELDVVVEDLTNLGVGVARHNLNDVEGVSSQWVIMIPLVLPGEKVRVRIFRNHASYSEADVLEILASSPDRVDPRCPHFARCGGCQYQHMNIDSQREWKRMQVISVLERIGDIKNPFVSYTVGTHHEYGYRSKITPHYDTPRSSGLHPLRIGFQQRGTRNIIDIDKCIIASPKINEKYAEVRQEIRERVAAAEAKPKKGATLLFREADDEYIETDNRKFITQTVNGTRFTFKAGEFFQNNPYVLADMQRHVVQQASEGSACKYLIDAYCGSGLFALSAAPLFQSVYGVEISELAVKASSENAKQNSISNAHFLCGASEQIFSKVDHLPSGDTVIILDPPRKGCDASFLQQLFAFSPRKIVYVSCDPATQARDAKVILGTGRYEITNITPFDLFPQTRHIENVITFIRRDNTY